MEKREGHRPPVRGLPLPLRVEPPPRRARAMDWGSPRRQGGVCSRRAAEMGCGGWRRGRMGTERCQCGSQS